MKKPYLLLLAIIPIFASCNKSGSFPNPFPNDTYKKTGFVIDDSEKTTRPLTNNETNIVLDTISEEKKDINDAKIYKMTSKKYTRDYTRAFAGEFKEGYNVKNVMKDEEITVTRQDEGDEVTGELPYANRQRTKTHNEYTTTSQYAYGQIEEKVVQDDYLYFKDGSGEEEIETKEGNVYLAQRTLKTEKGTYATHDDKKLSDKTENRSTLIKNFYITQSQYISAPDLKSGADKEGNIILVKATQVKHTDAETGKEGIFTLKDGRSYQAMDNSLTVTKLKIDETTKDWCLATYVRIYKETVITSEVIQPNVQVTKLKNPITISFSEEKCSFSTDNTTHISENLPPRE